MLVAGVDGGGSKTSVTILKDGDVIATGSAGSSNPNSVGPDRAFGRSNL